MEIKLNVVGIKIDGKVYKFRKMNFGFQRRMIELQKEINKKQKEYAKKYEVKVTELDGKLSQDEQIEMSELSLVMQQALAELLVDKEDVAIIDQLDQDNISQLITSLQ